jgi:hypothetical protein
MILPHLTTPADSIIKNTYRSNWKLNFLYPAILEKDRNGHIEGRHRLLFE